MKKSIRKSIETLKHEIQALDEDSAAKNNLEEIINRLETEIEKDNFDSIDDITETLNNSLSQFETTHPKITETINGIMTTLSTLGI